jgi:RHS repeat-associated protein
MRTNAREATMKKLLSAAGLAVALGLAFGAGSVRAQTQPLVPSNPYSYARTTSYTYYGPTDGAKNGLLAGETIEPTTPEACVEVTYDYDAWGNRRITSTANCGISSGRALFASRSETASFTGTSSQPITVQGSTVNVQVPDGQFATSIANALTHARTLAYDPRTGAVLRETDPNGLSTSVQVDDFGRKVIETLPDNTRALTWYCVIGAGLDTSSNTVLSGITCPTPASGEAPADAVQFIHSERRDGGSGLGTQIGPFTRTYTDRLGREIRRVSQSFDGAVQPATRRDVLVVRDTVYNAFGAKQIETQPYFLASGSGSTGGSNDRGLTRTDYDTTGRPTAVYTADADGSQPSVSFGPYGTARAARQTFAYDGLSVTVTNDKGYTRKEEKNPLGEVVRITDSTGGQLVRQFDAFGNLTGTKDPLNNRVRLAYDLRGRKVQLNDPDAGIIDYCNDALGQLKAQQNALMRGAAAPGQCPDDVSTGTTAVARAGWSTYAYDKLGRTTQRIDPEYSSSWTYDSCSKGKGKLCASSTSHGVQRQLVYDGLGRLANQRTDITGGPSFASALAYDAATGRLASKTYPTGLNVQYSYTGLGHLEKLLLTPAATLTPLPSTPGGSAGATVSGPGGGLLWQAQVVNAQGKPEQQYFGNGVTGRATYDAASGHITALVASGSSSTVLDQRYGWDSLGNLTSRQDAVGDGNTGAVTENFSYADGLNRLTGYSVSAANIPGLVRNVSLDYNVLGLLLRKSDVGTYTYATQGGAKPHAVRGIAGAVNSSFDYDDNGNLKSASSGKYRSLTYTSFNLPDSNTGAQGPGGSPKYTWSYDEEHARFKEVHVGASGTRTTWYLHPDNAGGLAFESETAPDGKLSQRHYLGADGQTIGVLVSTAPLPSLAAGQTAPTVLSSVNLAKVEYWHEDHLGSLAATTDHQGNVTARYAYDPFGKRRYSDGRYDAAGNLVVDWSPNVNNGTDRGFTGHEHLDDIGLVHMNGRIYDPLIGRFMSADPHVTKPDVLQNYDRYSYVLNNPLNATDPTGFDVKCAGHIAVYCDVVGQWTQLTMPGGALAPSGQIDQKATLTRQQFLSATAALEKFAQELPFSYAPKSDAEARERLQVLAALKQSYEAIYSAAPSGYSLHSDQAYLGVRQQIGIHEYYSAQFGGKSGDGALASAMTAMAVGGIKAEFEGGGRGPGGATGKAVGRVEATTAGSVAEAPKYVYRGLAKGEEIANGLSARSPGAGNSELSHVAGKRASQWISTTKDLNVAVEKYGEHGVVRIDLSKVKSQVSDVSGGFRNAPRQSNWAKKDQEVLVRDFVPPQAIERIR